MICALEGLTPPDPKLGDHIRSQVTVVEDTKVEWRPSYAIAPDDDRDGAETLLLTAITKGSCVEALHEAVEKAAKDYSTDACCTMWATAPAPLPLRPLDGYEPHIEVGHETAVMAMKKWGLWVRKQVMDAQGVARFRAIVDSAIADIHRALEEHRPQLTVGQDSFLFREIASRNKERFDLRLSSSPKALALVHELVLSNDTTQQFLQEALGLSPASDLLEEIDFDLSVVYSRPGAGAQGWHADGSHMAQACDAGWKQEGYKTQLANAYAICLFVPLMDLNDEVGYTQFWPGSHQHRGLVGFGPAATVTRSVWNGCCPAGDGIFYDYRLLHQGMPNTSQTVTRPVLQIIFKRKWYVEKANYGVDSLYTR